MRLTTTTPSLRMFRPELTRAFHTDWLGFRWDWEHRFAPGMPLYAQVSRDAAILHLSEHHGDATPGGAVRLRCEEVDALAAALAPRSRARPAVAAMPWGERALAVTDPSGNRRVFFTPQGG